MADMEALYERFARRGLLILAISDEAAGKVQPLIVEWNYRYPILLDPGRKAQQSFDIDGIPKSLCTAGVGSWSRKRSTDG
jgi:hypothetical protein